MMERSCFTSHHLYRLCKKRLHVIHRVKAVDAASLFPEPQHACTIVHCCHILALLVKCSDVHAPAQLALLQLQYAKIPKILTFRPHTTDNLPSSAHTAARAPASLCHLTPATAIPYAVDPETMLSGSIVANSRIPR